MRAYVALLLAIGFTQASAQNRCCRSPSANQIQKTHPPFLLISCCSVICVMVRALERAGYQPGNGSEPGPVER